MNNPFANLGYQEGVQQEKDSLGGGSFIHDSGVYTAKVKYAFAKKSQSGALALEVQLDLGEGKQHKETFWMTNKEGSNTYSNKDGVRSYLPGFLTADSLSLLTAGQPLSELSSEEKVVKLYDPEVKQEVPTKVPMFMDIVGKDIKVGLIKQLSFKQAKNENSGKWEDTSDTREENIVDKFFRNSDDKTVLEIRQKKDTAIFINDWKAKWEGNVRDKTKGKTPTATTTTTASKPTSGMFS